MGRRHCWKTVASDMTVSNEDKKKKSVIRKIFATGERSGRKILEDSFDDSESQPNSALESLIFSGIQPQMPNSQSVESFRVFVSTWNMGGLPPNGGLNLDDFLDLHDEANIYVFGYEFSISGKAGYLYYNFLRSLKEVLTVLS